MFEELGEDGYDINMSQSYFDGLSEQEKADVETEYTEMKAFAKEVVLVMNSE